MAASRLMPDVSGSALDGFVSSLFLRQITRLIFVPFSTLSGDLGFWLMIWPFSTESLDSYLTLPMERPISFRIFSASSIVSPFRSGIRTSSPLLPLLTVRWIVRWALTTAPPDGVWLMTSPIGTSELSTSLTDTSRFFFFNIFLAISTCFPVTSGTVIFSVLQKLPKEKKAQAKVATNTIIIPMTIDFLE